MLMKRRRAVLQYFRVLAYEGNATCNVDQSPVRARRGTRTDMSAGAIDVAVPSRQVPDLMQERDTNLDNRCIPITLRKCSGRRTNS